jgi:hypothetical protein
VGIGTTVAAGGSPVATVCVVALLPDLSVDPVVPELSMTATRMIEATAATADQVSRFRRLLIGFFRVPEGGTGGGEGGATGCSGSMENGVMTSARSIHAVPFQ